MIEAIDPVNTDIAQRIVYIQRSAYSVEASLIGFDGIPQLDEAVEDVMALNNLQWRGAFDGNALAGVIAWQIEQDVIEIDRLAIDPRFARRGHGRQLVRAVPPDRTTIVSTGTDNRPACDLYVSEGFTEVGRTEVAAGIFTTQFSRPVPAAARAINRTSGGPESWSRRS